MNIQAALEHRTQVEEFQREHRTGLVTLVFTDLVDSVALRRQMGDQAGTSLLQAHRQLVRQTLARFADAEEIETAGDSFLLLFARPSDSVKFTLLVQRQTHALARERDVPLAVRMGIHVGEVVIEEHDRGSKLKDLYGSQIDLCARVMGLAESGQVLLTRAVFDSARQAIKGEDIEGVKELSWLNHGPYLLKGIEESVEVCEVGEVGVSPLKAPTGSEKAKRQVSPDSEPVLGWRPALGQAVPNTQWVLEKKLGEGGFGEVWLGRHQKLKEQRVFKFCFRADRVRSLKREMTLFRVLKERVGDHPNIVRLLEVYFEEPPFYVVMDHVEGQDLKVWCGQQAGEVPLAARLEIVAQIADALQAAHDAGVIHRDVKPGNILVSGQWSVVSGEKPQDFVESSPSHPPPATRHPPLSAKLTDFGIGQVLSEEALKGVTKAGFTETLVADSSSSHTGSQMYMAPELFAGKPASIRSDIYSLGVVLYQLLVGDLTRPVTTDWAREIADPLLRDDLGHCFAGDPNERFAGAGQLAKHLRALPQRRATLEQQQAELVARERAAYRRGIMRTTVAAALIVVALGILAVTAIQQRNRARTGELTNRRLLYAAEVNLAQHALQDGNIDRALELLEAQRPNGPAQADLRGFEWRFLRQLCRPDELFTLRGLKGLVQSVAISPDGKVLAAGDFGEGTVHIWDVATRREIIPPLTSVFGVRSVVFSRDGKVLAAGGGDRSVHLWETVTWREVATLEGHADSVERVAISPDGKLLAAATTGDEAARLWSLETKQVLATFTGPPYVRACVAFSSDGQWLAFGRGDKTVVLVDVHTRREVGALAGHENVVTYLDFSPDSKTLATASSDGTVKLWEVGTRREVGALVGHKAHITSVAFSRDGHSLATSCSDTTIKLWDFASRKELTTLRGHTNWVNNVAFFPDGRTLASGSDDTTVKLWDAHPKTQDYILGGGSNLASFVEVSPDGRLLATALRDGSLVFWDVATQKARRTLRVPTSLIMSGRFSPDGKTFFTYENDGVGRLWEIASQKESEIWSFKKPGITEATFSGDGRMLGILGEREAKLLDATTGKELASLARDGLRFLRVSPNGKILAFGPEGTALRGWDVMKGNPVVTLAGITNQFSSFAFSRDLKTAASIGADFKLSFWDSSSGRKTTTLTGHKAFGNTLRFSPDGQVLASGGQDNTIKIWDVARAQEIATLRGHSGYVTLVAFSPDGKSLASASMDGTVKLWSMASHREVLTMPGHIAPTLQLLHELGFALNGNALFCFGAKTAWDGCGACHRLRKWMP